MSLSNDIVRGSAGTHLSRQVQPVYLQLAATLRDELGAYLRAEYLPSDAQLAARFGVNRHTVRRAIDVLALEGRVLRHKGRGTCVLGAPIVYPLNAGSAYSHTLSSLGLHAEARLLAREQRAPSPWEADKLGLDPDGLLIEIRTLRLLEGEPISLIRHCFGARHRAVLEDYRGGSMRAHLASRHMHLRRSATWIGASNPSADVALRLLMPRNAPVLSIRTLSCDREGLPVELSSSLSRADRFTYYVDSGEQNDE